MRLLPNLTRRSSVGALFLPSDRFFLRLVPLAADLPPAAQAELALEGLAPFPPAQLYWGCCLSPARTSALVYAAHRRRFTAEETAAWERGDVAVPDILPLIGAAPSQPALRIQAGETSLSGAAWDGAAAWPVAVHARAYPAAPTENDRRQFAAELAAKAKLPDAPVAFVSGAPRARREGENLMLELADASGAVLAATAVPPAGEEALDVRDRAFLEKRRRDLRRGELVWKLFLAAGAAAALALMLDLGAATFRLMDRSVRARVVAQAPLIEKLEAAHGLNSRLDELMHRRLRFFEMLAAVNAPRPHSIQFLRTGTNGHNTLEIEAQTNAPDDVGTYESALRHIASLDKVEVRDLRARDGVTTFSLAVAFKPDAALGNGGAP